MKGGKANADVVSGLRRAEAMLVRVVDDPEGHTCDILRELGVAAQTDPAVREHLARAVSFLPLVVRVTVGGSEATEMLVDIGGECCEVADGDITVQIAIGLRYAGPLEVASLGGDLPDHPYV